MARADDPVLAALRGRSQPVGADGLAAWDEDGRRAQQEERWREEERVERRRLLAEPEPSDPWKDRSQDMDEQQILQRQWERWAQAHLDELRESYPVVPAPEDASTSDDAESFSRALAAELKKRSGKAWSVTGSRGTGAGWYRISAPPRRRVDDYMTTEDRIELAALLNLQRPVHPQGESVMARRDAHDEYLDRARGYEPRSIGVADWD